MDPKNSTNTVQTASAVDFIETYDSVIAYSAYASLPIGALGCILNVVLSRILIRQLRTGTNSWKRLRLLLNLSITDVITSAYLMASGSTQIILRQNPPSRASGAAREVMEALKCVTALPPALNYQAMCFFQYLALRRPIQYSSLITEKFCNGIILTQWVGILGISSLFGVKVFMRTSPARDSFSLSLELLQMIVYALVAIGSTVGYVTSLITIIKRRRCPKDKRRSARYAFLSIVSVNFVVMAVFMIALFIVTTLLFLSMKKIYDYKHASAPSDFQILRSYFEHRTQHMLIVTCWMLRLIIDPALHLRFNQQLHSYHSGGSSFQGSIRQNSRLQAEFNFLTDSPSITPRVERKLIAQHSMVDIRPTRNSVNVPSLSRKLA